MDAKPRELYLLFRAYKGFEGSLLKVTNKNGKNLSVILLLLSLMIKILLYLKILNSYSRSDLLLFHLEQTLSQLNRN